MKYWFITVQWRYHGTLEWIFENNLINISPIQYIANMKESLKEEFVLLSAMEVTEDMFLKHKDMFE